MAAASSGDASSGGDGRILGLPRAGVLSFLVALGYGASSAALALLNKTLLSSYHFNGYFLLLAAQMGLQLALCTLSRDALANPMGIPAYSRTVHAGSLRMGVLGVANVALGFVALQMVNVPMFLCIRRLVAPFILFYEFVFLGKTASAGIQGAVGAILVGTLLAGWDSLNADMVGYAITILNNLFSAAAGVSTKEFATVHRFGVMGTLYYNSMTAFPLAALGALAFGEVSALSSFHYLRDPAFWINFCICVSMGPVITFTSILCTTYNSPLATAITGNVKDIFVTVIGAVAFAGFDPTALTVMGLLTSFAGAGLYSYVSLQAAMGGGAKGAPLPPPPAADEAAEEGRSPEAEDAQDVALLREEGEAGAGAGEGEGKGEATSHMRQIAGAPVRGAALR